MASTDSPGSGFYGLVVFSVLVGAPTAFFLEYEQLAFLIVGLGCFLMLAGLVAVLVLMNNQENDRDNRARDRDTA